MPRYGNTTQRGYGYSHQQERKRWAAVVARGAAVCCRCHRQIRPGAPFDLDHSDDRAGYIGVSCVGCNRAAGARKSNRLRRARRLTQQGATRLRW